MRTLTSWPVALVLSATALAACGSSGDDSDAKCESDYTSGKTSNAVKVTGDFGKTEPKATFDTPLTIKADDLQRTIVTEGDGDTIADKDQVELVISVFNGRTGDQAVSEQATLTAGDENTYEAFRAALDCVAVGSRVVTTVSSTDLFGEEGNESLEIKAGDPLVIVSDLVDIREPVKASKWTEGAPEVTFKKSGEPQLKLSGEGPDDVLVKVLKEGDGQEVAAGDQITVNYQGRTWEDSGKIFQQTWGQNGQPAPINTDQVVPGFKAGLVGQKVGSTVLINIPAEYGYGEEKTEENELSGKTLVFVVEIVSIDS